MCIENLPPPQLVGYMFLLLLSSTLLCTVSFVHTKAYDSSGTIPRIMVTPDVTSGSNNVAGDVDTIEHLSRNNKNGREIPAEGCGARKGVTCLATNDTQLVATPHIELQPELLLLGAEARDFFVSQGITTVKAFHSARAKDMATALAK